MEISKLIGCLEFNVDLYDIKLLVKDDKKLDIYVRHNTRMSIYEAKAYELTKIGSKTVEIALSGQRKDISVSFSEAKCQEQEILEMKIVVELPLLPKTTETIHIPLIKNLKDGEILHSKLGDAKRKIIQHYDTVGKFYETTKNKFFVEKKEMSYSGASKEDLVSLRLPKGTYIATMSGLICTNASNYMSLGINKVEICPGTYIGTPPDAQHTNLAYFTRAIVQITEPEDNLTFWGNVGSSYSWVMRNFIMTAERISVN